MQNEEKYILRQNIASILDHPSVYMGGPSIQSIRKAIKIVEYLDRECSIEAGNKIQESVEIVKTWRTDPWDKIGK